MEYHDSPPRLSQGVPCLATPDTKFVGVLHEQSPDTHTTDAVHVNNNDLDADSVTKETCPGARGKILLTHIHTPAWCARRQG